MALYIKYIPPKLCVMCTLFSYSRRLLSVIPKCFNCSLTALLLQSYTNFTVGITISLSFSIFIGHSTEMDFSTA